MIHEPSISLSLAPRLAGVFGESGIQTGYNAGKRIGGDYYMLAKTTCSALIACAVLMTACAPTVKVEAPEKPIEINMNVKIEHEIRVKVEQDVEQLLESKPDLF